MDVQKKLDEIVEAVSSARSMPMSASCVINRAELLEQLEEVRNALPGSLAQAEELLGGRERMVEEAQREAERIIESAHAERGSLISGTEVARQSQNEAERILAEARREAEEIRAEADDYVDSKLANFEVVLTKTIGSVDRGREKLLGRGPGLDDQGYEDEEAPERSADPEILRERADAYVDTKLGAFEAVLTKTLDAVGRGRQKLHGRRPIDDLGAHLAAQGEAARQHGAGSDADYLADLAGAKEQPGPVARESSPPAEQPQPAPAQQPAPAAGQQDYYTPVAGYQQEPYGGYQSGYPQQEAYGYQGGYQQESYGYPEYSQQHAYGQGGEYSQQPDQYQQGAQYPQQPEGYPQQTGALDETSLFDTAMIDLNQLQQYDQRGH
ncbi:ATP synthase F0 subunit B [Streptomyces sp. TP-A0874]|uniref:ATP synthase F0 subunit B n=1 Tax=Streptomyces sp. TP-A0874 TaxID=549819 RepID=UPI000853AB1F|nr:ATP synthase F0 subunit B [Streptomyces sp. TP-A0874]